MVGRRDSLSISFNMGRTIPSPVAMRQGRAYCGRLPTLVLHGDYPLGAYESLAG